MVVKCHTVLYMYVEVLIGQSERSPEVKMILQNPGETSNQLRWVKECGGNSPSFGGEFSKTLLFENMIFVTFQNCGILDLPHFCICQYYRYGSE